MFYIIIIINNPNGLKYKKYLFEGYIWEIIKKWLRLRLRLRISFLVNL